MPLININGLVSFATNYGVLVHEKARSATPQELFDAVQTAYAHINDPPLVDACCGGRGPLAEYLELSFEDYLSALREIEVSLAGAAAKKEHTKVRRSEFNRERSSLVLAMLDAGVPYACAMPGCGAIVKLTVDHIRALSRGGTDEIENLRFLCLPHNSAKGDRNEDS
jgi:5-methylcytosine-specific restriction endonuclease McrA